ncbi:MAG: ribosome-associated translation inhibitor RaiA [Candidatus Uhrbacteria bacterium]
MIITAIKATNMEMTEAIENYVREKLESLDKLMVDFQPEPEAGVEVGKTSDHHAKGPFFFAEANLSVPGNNLLRARVEVEDLYEAIDLMKDDLRRQVVDFKDKLVESHREPRPDKV